MDRHWLQLKPTESLVFESARVAIGTYVCAPRHPLFREPSEVLVSGVTFARTSTAIESSTPPFLESPDVVCFYNRGERYRQRMVSPEGANCDWYAIRDDLLRDALDLHSPRLADGEVPRFPLSWIPCPGSLYLEQRTLFRAARRGLAPPDEIEESVLSLLDSLLEAACGAERPRREPGRVTDAARAILAEDWNEALPLARVAAEVGVSMPHLCRRFRRDTGMSLSDYRGVLRARASLQEVDGARKLSDVATDLGFSSHSHFSYRFRREFGVSPSRLRERWRRRPPITESGETASRS